MKGTHKLSVTATISHYELTDRPTTPSETFRQHEARLIAELARMAHLESHRFDGWPAFSLRSDEYRGSPSPYFHLQAEVKAVPL